MNRIIFLTVSFFILMSVSFSVKSQTYTIETALGSIEIKLYDNTPLHKANFEKLVENQVYDGVLFHRIIQNFMIQGGDPATKGSDYVEGETIPAEFVPENFHKKGALAAARTGDMVNPEKRSSPTQFYIVQGKTYTDDELKYFEEYGGKSWTAEQKEIYKTVGGTPFLDQDYTVFGEVVNGLDVLDKIAAVPTLPNDRPVENISIIKVVKN